MSLVESFNRAPLLLKIALGIAFIGWFFHLLGFATPYWSTAQYFSIIGIDVHFGLWFYCARGCEGYSHVQSWMEATQAFAILGFLAGLAAIVLAVLYVFLEQLRKDIIYIIASLGNLVAAGCIFLAVVIFGSKITTGLSWSFGLSIVGMIFHGVAGVLMGVNRFQNKPQ
ncbi:uncharacterized protein LOC132546636 isoform X2 [Ylistrum balloti]|uniref:uncharacterized protein LOC132546636 isoform X2 n=1 Tax=Ylistrum balloti TaxID=509963 RepID=UPI002905D7AA|nr:uncharacterized protein LOC132546636 isoform X2 [Ylistrum balloti]